VGGIYYSPRALHPRLWRPYSAKKGPFKQVQRASGTSPRIDAGVKGGSAEHYSLTLRSAPNVGVGLGLGVAEGVLVTVLVGILVGVHVGVLVGVRP
jgi:hypothetical protein